MKLTITLENITRNYDIDEDQIVNNDWSAVLANMFDTLTQSSE